MCLRFPSYAEYTRSGNVKHTYILHNRKMQILFIPNCKTGKLQVEWLCAYNGLVPKMARPGTQMGMAGKREIWKPRNRK